MEGLQSSRRVSPPEWEVAVSPKARRELERRLLDAYVEELRSYRATWALPASRTVHLNAWAAARAKVDPKNLRKTS